MLTATKSIQSSSSPSASSGEWLFVVALAVVLFGVSEAALLADRHNWWIPGDELLSLIWFASFFGAACVGFFIAFGIGFPTLVSLWSRLATALFFAAVAFKVGGRFLHLCPAGSTVIEAIAVFGSPLVVGAMTLSIRHRGLAVLLATLFLVCLWLLAAPYLQWAHRP